MVQTIASHSATTTNSPAPIFLAPKNSGAQSGIEHAVEPLRREGGARVSMIALAPNQPRGGAHQQVQHGPHRAEPAIRGRPGGLRERRIPGTGSGRAAGREKRAERPRRRRRGRRSRSERANSAAHCARGSWSRFSIGILTRPCHFNDRYQMNNTTAALICAQPNQRRQRTQRQPHASRTTTERRRDGDIAAAVRMQQFAAQLRDAAGLRPAIAGGPRRPRAPPFETAAAAASTPRPYRAAGRAMRLSSVRGLMRSRIHCRRIGCAVFHRSSSGYSSRPSPSMLSSVFCSRISCG